VLDSEVACTLVAMGFVELLALLATLSGFGVDENPNAPSAADVLATAPARADYMMHVDFVSIVPNNYDRIAKLPEHPSLAKDEEARSAMKMIVGQIEAGRSFAKASIGLDPITDITSATLWFAIPDAGKEQVLVVVRGKIPNDLVDMIAGTAGMKIEKVQGISAAVPEPGMMIAVSPRGELLAGSAAWVAPRLAKGWKRKRNSAITRGAAPLLDAKPAIVLVSAPNKRALRKMASELTSDDERMALDLLSGHEILGVSVLHNGLEWTVQAREKSGYKRAVRASEGAIDLMRATHHGTRGLAQLALAVLPSFGGSDEIIDGLVRHQDEIMELVLATTGDGNFQVDVSKDERSRTVHVKALGKELSDVLPAAGLLPVVGGAAAWLMMGGGAKSTAPQAVPAMP